MDSNDITKLIHALGENYPKWIKDGLEKSPYIKSMEKSLAAMNKQAGISSKETKKHTESVRESASSFDELSGKSKKLADNWDDAAAGVKKSSKVNTDAFQKHGKAVLEHSKSFINDLRSGNLSGAVKGFASGVEGLSSYLPGLYSAYTLMKAAIIKSVEILEVNTEAFYKLSESGVNIGYSFGGISLAAANANISISKYSKILDENSDILAISNDTGAKGMSSFIRNMQHGEKSVFALGYTLDQATDAMTSYNKIQKLSGLLRSQDEAQRLEGGKAFMSEIDGYATALGMSRKEIMDSVQKSAADPLWQTYAATHQKSAEAMNDAAAQFTSIAGKDTGEAITKLVQEMVTTGGAPVTEESKKLVESLAATNPELLKLATSTADNVRNGKETSDLQIKTADALRKTNMATAETMIQSGHFGKSLTDLVGSVTLVNQTTDDEIRQRAAEKEVANQRNAAMEQFNSAISEVENSFNKIFINLFGGPMSVMISKGLSLLAKLITDDVVPALDSFANWIADIVDPETRDIMMQKLINSISDSFQDAMDNVKAHLPKMLGGGAVDEEAKKKQRADRDQMLNDKQTEKRTAREASGGFTSRSWGAATPAGPGGAVTPPAGDDRQTAIIRKTLEKEGGGKITNIAGDRGGVTKYGISQKSGLSPEQIKSLTEEQAIEIYKKQYWDKAGIGNMPPEMQLEGFDTAVNLGPGKAKSFAAKSGGDVNAFAGMRQQFYQNLAASDPSQQKFLKGWTNRNNDIAQQSAAYGGIPNNTTTAVADTTTVAATPSETAASPPADPLLTAITQQVNLLKDAVDKLNMIAVNTSTSNVHMKNMTAEIKNNSVNT